MHNASGLKMLSSTECCAQDTRQFASNKGNRRNVNQEGCPYPDTRMMWQWFRDFATLASSRITSLDLGGLDNILELEEGGVGSNGISTLDRTEQVVGNHAVAVDTTNGLVVRLGSLLQQLAIHRRTHHKHL